MRWRTRLAVAPLLAGTAQHAAGCSSGSGGGGSWHLAGDRTAASISCGLGDTASSITTTASNSGSGGDSGDGSGGSDSSGVPGGTPRGSQPDLVPVPLLTPPALRALPARPAEEVARQGLALVRCAGEGLGFLGAINVTCAVCRALSRCWASQARQMWYVVNVRGHSACGTVQHFQFTPAYSFGNSQSVVGSQRMATRITSASLSSPISGRVADNETHHQYARGMIP